MAGAPLRARCHGHEERVTWPVAPRESLELARKRRARLWPSGAAGAASLPVGVAMALARDLPRLRGAPQPPSHGGKVRLLLPCCSLFDLPVCFRVILVWIGITKAQPFWRAYGRLMLRTICGSASGHWSVALSLTVCLLLVPRSRTMLTLLLAESH